MGRDGDRARSGDRASSPSRCTGAGVVLPFLAPALVGAGAMGRGQLSSRARAAAQGSA